MKDINIVFVNYLMKDQLLCAIDSVLKDIADCPYDVQITVVDNSRNEDGIQEEISSRFPSVFGIDPGENAGFGRGNTIGFQKTPARYYLALNCDTVIPEQSGTIARMIRFMDDNPKIGCIGPKLLNSDGSVQYSCYRFDLLSILIKPFKQLRFDERYAWVRKRTHRLLMRDFDHGKTQPVDWVLGAAMMVRKEVIEDVGWFDERYFMYLEDADWCRRMWGAGWPVYYVHDIVIRHAHARESAKIPGLFRALCKNKLARIHAMSWIKFLWKWRGTFRYYW